MKSYKIQSNSKEGLTEYLSILFAEINADEFPAKTEVLIHINATNGNLCISGFDSKTNTVHDEKCVFVYLTEFREENKNAYDFDEIINKALRNEYLKSYNSIFKKKYQIFFQTEDENNAKQL